MPYPWQGAAKRLQPEDFVNAAEQLGCEPAAIRAVWEVEAAGSAFRYDGSLERRYEPHHFPGSGVNNWRESMKIGKGTRETMFAAAYRADPEAACKATSWGGPQIMGFNHAEAGYPTAQDMVKAMAGSEADQLTAFVNFCRSKGLDTHLRALNWRAFALRYNGSGQPGIYAARMESAYRRHSGKASPVVLREGARGASVRQLQAVLGVPADGAFGADTAAALREFQAAQGLKPDGIAGAKTWEALEASGTRPEPKPAVADITGKVTAIAGATTAAGGAVAAIGDSLPETALNIFMGGGVVAGLIAVGAWAFVRVRR